MLTEIIIKWKLMLNLELKNHRFNSISLRLGLKKEIGLRSWILHKTSFNLFVKRHLYLKKDIIIYGAISLNKVA